MSKLFKRRVENFGDPVEKDARTEILEGLAEMSVEEKRAFVSDLPADMRKALRNEVLLASATAGYPPAEEGFAARALREMRSRSR